MKKSDYSRIEAAIQFLYQKRAAHPRLTELATHLGLSEYHCHRLFKKWAGVTPKDFLRYLTLVKSKKMLRSKESLLATSLELGLSSTSRLHDLFSRVEGVTPGEYKRLGDGLTIYWSVTQSRFGKLGIGSTARGICSLEFVDREGEYLLRLTQLWPKAKLIKNARKHAEIAQEIELRLQGKSKKGLHLWIKGTDFQLKVWEALLRIPEGKIATYQKIASAIDLPKANRAVGSAIGSNPVSLLIPCHRVIQSTGDLGDYLWGAEKKALILGVELARNRTEKF